MQGILITDFNVDNGSITQTVPVVLIVGNPIKALEEICTERKMEYPVRMDITPECATFEWKSNISSNTYGVSYQIIEVQVQEV